MRSSIFGDLNPLQDPIGADHIGRPLWVEEARAALDREGDFLAFDDDGVLRVVELPNAFTRIGRSLSADVRFDDPTVSRRHALVHRSDGAARILDDRSLNGVFVDGERIDMHELRDGDQVTIGRFELYFLQVAQARALQGERPAF
jgi:pSer/pThr/pTyr-binding forkhead associated (FHA) protein